MALRCIWFFQLERGFSLVWEQVKSMWCKHCSAQAVLCLSRTLWAGPPYRDRSLMGRIWVTAPARQLAASLITVVFNHWLWLELLTLTWSVDFDFEGISWFSAPGEANRKNGRHIARWNTLEAMEKWIPANATEGTLLSCQVQSHTIRSAMKKTTAEEFPGRTRASWWWQWPWGPGSCPWQALSPKDFTGATSATEKYFLIKSNTNNNLKN